MNLTYGGRSLGSSLIIIVFSSAPDFNSPSESVEDKVIVKFSVSASSISSFIKVKFISLYSSHVFMEKTPLLFDPPNCSVISTEPDPLL